VTRAEVEGAQAESVVHAKTAATTAWLVLLFLYVLFFLLLLVVVVVVVVMLLGKCLARAAGRTGSRSLLWA